MLSVHAQALIVMYVPKLQGGSGDGYFRVFRILALQWAVAVSFFFLYLVIMLGVPVPDWSYSRDGTMVRHRAAPCRSSAGRRPPRRRR